MVTAIVVSILVFVALSGIRMTSEWQRGVVLRLGRYVATHGPGVYYNLPLIESQSVVDLRTESVVIEQQETITKDSVTVRVDAVLWFHVVDPRKAVVLIHNAAAAVVRVALTNLRTVVGQHLLDELLRDRASINEQLRAEVDAAANAWGMSVERIELKDIKIPDTMQRAMAREAEAIRERRARTIKAEGEKDASERLAQAAERMAATQGALELRRLQTIAEIGAENNSTTILVIPSEITDAARAIAGRKSA